MGQDEKQIANVLLKKLRTFRENSGFSSEQVEKMLIIGPGWIDLIETGKITPTLDVILTLLSIYKKSLTDLVGDIQNTTPKINRSMYARESKNGIDIHFAYSKFDAVYRLPEGSIGQYDSVILSLRNGLAKLSRRDVSEDDAKAIKTESVTNAFLKAVKLWPNTNPSDIWWFIIYRAYCDQYNHPAVHSRLDFQQSWKRTGGWALERILEKYYSPKLRKHGINIRVARLDEKKKLLNNIKTDHRVEADKVDVLLTVGENASEKLIGVVHVKASFAERRTDDVPMSKALVDAGYISPLWTMDCKSAPGSSPINHGELGGTFSGKGDDNRSAKRKDIEDDAFFSACFSYNKNTQPTPIGYQTARAKIYVCNFSNEGNAEDDFVKFIITERTRIKARLHI